MITAALQAQRIQVERALTALAWEVIQSTGDDDLPDLLCIAEQQCEAAWLYESALLRAHAALAPMRWVITHAEIEDCDLIAHARPMEPE